MDCGGGAGKAAEKNGSKPNERREKEWVGQDNNNKKKKSQGKKVMNKCSSVWGVSRET